ncbi:MAG: RHS repeat domain-containing protein [Acidobacteriaceae bacterium]
MRKLAVVCLCVTLGLLSKSYLHAQDYLYQIGSPTFSTQIPIENGFINVNNGDIHIEIPLATQKQRGRLQLDEKLVYDSRIWKIIDNSGYSWQPTNVPNSMGGWVFSSGLGPETVVFHTENGQIPCQAGGVYTYQQYWNWTWSDPQGTVHPFSTVSTLQYHGTGAACVNPPPGTPSSGGYASDGSGYYLQVSNYTSPVITDQQGNVYHPTVFGASYPPNSSDLIADSNGNYYSNDGNGNLVDTLERTPVLVITSGNQIDYDVLTYGGARSRYTVTTETVYYNTDFAEQSVTESSGSFTAIQSIQLPDGSSYSFTYDSGTSSGHYGELTSVTLPSGGIINYNWQNFKDSFQNENRWIYSRVKDGGTTTFHPSVISQCTSSTGCQEKSTVTSPAGNDTVYTFTLDSGADLNAGSWNTGIDAYQGSSTSGGTKLKSVSTAYTYTTYPVTVDENGTNYIIGSFKVPATETMTTTLDDVGLTSQTQTSFGYMAATTTSVKQWDYYSGSAPSSPTTETDYTYYSGAYPSRISVKDGAGNLISQTTYSYDQTTPTATSGLPNHGSASGTRANLTTVAQWINTSGSTQNATMAYDDAGTLLTSTDPNGKTTYGHDPTDTFVISTTPPAVPSGVDLTSRAQYDPSTGLLMSTTDPNTQPTTYKFYDAFGRPGEVDYPGRGKITLSYTPTQLSELDYQSASVYADKETLYDSYGRLSRVALYNGQAASQDWYQTDTCYNADGEVDFKSYSYQGTGFAQGKVCSGAGDSYAYDALGRVTGVTHGDGTSIGYAYTGRAIETTDENGVKQIAQTDAFGRTTAVCEISSDSSMPDSGSPMSCGTDIAGTGFITSYAYTPPASHMTTITQGAQTRVFQTDSLGRTIMVQQPESGQTSYSYTYNSTGLSVARVRPAANPNPNPPTTTTTTQYDAVGRVVSISYTDGTPTKTFAYDASSAWPWSGFTPTNLKGRLYAAITGNQALGTVYSYDVSGRVNMMRQCGPSNCGTSGYATSYSYDGTGDLQYLDDGQGVTESFTYSPAGEVTLITSSASGPTHPPTIVSNVQYGPDGPLSWQLGNGLYAVRSYDSMGRINGGWVCIGTTQTFCTGGSTVYGYTIAWSGSQATQVCDTVLNRCLKETYDEFNRLASQTATTGAPDNFTYVYDRYGNRWEQNVTGGSGPSPQLSFDPSTNRVAPASGYTYDAAGNLIWDGVSNYTYDAEGNLTKVDGGATASYTFNALNQRVRIDFPSDSSASEEFIFDPWGRHTSSHDVVDDWGWARWIYWGASSTRVAVNIDSQTYFDHPDWEGTERMRTTYNGNVDGSFSSLPFGDGYAASGTDRDPYHFAMMDKDYYDGYDSETEHAQYRQYGETQGRWMSPDPYSGSYDFSNPQSFNRYSYVLNNPFAFIDPTGQGLEGALGCIGGPIGCVVGIVGSAILDDWLFNSIFGGPSFHGSLKPRPNTDPWSEYSGITYGPDIAGAFGLPDPGCDFGACGAGPNSFQSADTLAWPAANWCIENLTICTTIGSVAGRVALRIGLAPVAATTMLLSMEGDNQPKPSDAACHEIVREAQRTCTAQYPFPGSGNQIGKWRACVRRIVEPTGCDF